MQAMPTLLDAYKARHRIRSMIRETPLTDAPELARQTGAKSVQLKMECRQHTGAFKVRGAANKILSLDNDAQIRGVITFSTGNHGKAVAYVAGCCGIPATVCLSENVPAYRVAMIRSLGAQVAVKGRSQDEAETHYQSLRQAHGYTPVVPFDDPLIIAGQGTIAIEILARLPEAQMLLIPLSGGGLLAGMAMVAKSINPDIHIVGLSIERSPAMIQSLKAGQPVQVPEKPSLADSLLGGIGFENQYTLPMVATYVDEHLLVSEEEIKAGMFHLFDTHRTIAEGAAAVGVGAMLSDRIDVRGKQVVAVVSGGTVESATYLQLMQEALERTSHP
jgi:threonine dehydratase